MISDLIAAEVNAGTYEPAVEPETLAYAIVRLGEAFLYNDAAAGMRGDVDRLREVGGRDPRREQHSGHGP
jgi:Tetracyclin repressor-like, C-terminal domain